MTNNEPYNYIIKFIYKLSNNLVLSIECVSVLSYKSFVLLYTLAQC